MRYTITALVAAGLLLAGCVTNRVPPGVASQPIEYQHGYAAGCDSGYVAAGHPYYRFNKDALRFGSDQLYAQGWNDGFQTCKGSYESIGRALR